MSEQQELAAVISLLSSNDELRQTVSECMRKIEKLETAHSKTAATGKKLERTVDHLSTTVAKISKLIGDSSAGAVAQGASQTTIEERISELQLKARQSAIRFRNIEHDLQRHVRRSSLEVKNLCPREDQSVFDVFLVFVNSVLRVAVDDSDIDDVRLLGRSDEKDHRPRPVLITFTCYRTRAQVYQVRYVTFNAVLLFKNSS